MTRVATVDPDIWTDLFLANSKSLGAVLDRLISRLGEYRDAVRSGDAVGLRRILAKGRKAKEFAK
jgi:prephenate dehydrogenase